MVQVIWSRAALRDLRSITGYLMAHDEAAARRISRDLVSLGNSLTDFPNRGRPADGYRVIVTVPPYVLRYAVADDTVRIVGIRHSRRRPQSEWT